MHEAVRLGCLFGCTDAQDELRHYLTCPILLALAGEPLCLPPSSPLRRAPHALSTMGLRPHKPLAFYLVYTMFAVYHNRKQNSIDLTTFNETDLLRCQAHARALLKKLEGMCNRKWPQVCEAHGLW